jgi:hypothetical protein
MKSSHAMMIIALLFLVFATTASLTFWGDISSPVKIGMFAFGFGAGVAAGTLISRYNDAAN